MKKEVYYVKSLEEDFATKTLKGKKKVTYQTVYNIVRTKTIQPNTKSFGRKRRLSCTVLDEKYTKTYRPQGIIFKTNKKPDYIIPFDLVLLSATDNIIVHYYRIKNNLHVYYNHTLIPGFDKFIFKSFNAMIYKYTSPEVVWHEVNRFRKQHGFNFLPHQKFRLAEYNEAVYHKAVKIEPVALFGYRPDTRKIAKKLNLPNYISAKQFYQSIRKKSQTKNVLIIGRFQPFHNGHLNLIRRYVNAGYFIKIAIGSAQKSFEEHNPLTVNEREKIIKKAMKEFNITKYNIYHISDTKRDSDYVKHVLKRVGDFEVVLTGNPLVLKLFSAAKKSWNIEAFEEGSGRPGGEITSGSIRKKWLKRVDKYGLPSSVFKYLKSINFSERLKKIQTSKS